VGVKKTLNGVRYDTGKAVIIGEANNMGGGVDSTGDFGYWSATLYRTPQAKRHFLAGRGGPATRFAQSAGRSAWVGGEGIIPLTDKDARQWAERYLTPEIVDEFFNKEEV
jgi:hypothetical protein